MRHELPPNNSDLLSSAAAIRERPRGVLPLSQRYGVTVNVAAEFIGISRSRIYELLHDGALEGKVIHGRRIVLVESMMHMLGEAPTAKRNAV